jgi:hypothetical protein
VKATSPELLAFEEQPVFVPARQQLARELVDGGSARRRWPRGLKGVECPDLLSHIDLDLGRQGQVSARRLDDRRVAGATKPVKVRPQARLRASLALLRPELARDNTPQGAVKERDEGDEPLATPRQQNRPITAGDLESLEQPQDDSFGCEMMLCCLHGRSRRRFQHCNVQS